MTNTIYEDRVEVECDGVDVMGNLVIYENILKVFDGKDIAIVYLPTWLARGIRALVTTHNEEESNNGA